MGRGTEFQLPTGVNKSQPRTPNPQPSAPDSIPAVSKNDKDSLFSLLGKIVSALAPSERLHFYELSDQIATAQTSALRENDSGYVRERVFDRLGFNAPKLNVYNDGPGTWYIRNTNDGSNFTEEFPLYEGEAKTFVNVYELRHRAPVEGLRYRITEHDLWKQKNVDFKAGRGYIRNSTLVTGNAVPTTAYTTADTHAIFTSLQRNATTGYVKNRDNSAVLYVWASEDGTEFGQNGQGLGVEYITVQPLSVFHIDGWSLHTIIVGADSNNVDYELVGG